MVVNFVHCPSGYRAVYILARARRYNYCILRKAAGLLQQVTVRTEDRKTLKPLLKSAIENEKKIVFAYCAYIKDTFG